MMDYLPYYSSALYRHSSRSSGSICVPCAGIFGIRSPCATFKELFAEPVWRITRRSGVGCNVTVPNWNSGCILSSSRRNKSWRVDATYIQVQGRSWFAVTRWWCAEAFENPSPWPNSLLTGKKTGSMRRFSQRADRSETKNPVIAKLFCEIPYVVEQGIFSLKQRTKKGENRELPCDKWE